MPQTLAQVSQVATETILKEQEKELWWRLPEQ